MQVEGGCYCKAVRYRAEGEPMLKLQCLCRECQYISGGGPNFTMAMPKAGFAYTKGMPRAFKRSDLETPAIREFCPDCGTHLVARAQRLPDAVLLKVGTLDDPSLFQAPQAAIFTIDRQPFHLIAPGVPAYERRIQR